MRAPQCRSTGEDATQSAYPDRVVNTHTWLARSVYQVGTEAEAAFFEVKEQLQDGVQEEAGLPCYPGYRGAVNPHAGVCSVSASEFVTVQRSVNCTVGQDCILNCTFNVTAGGGWGERSAVIWRRAETKYEVHVYINNRDQLEDQLPQYVNRTSLSDSELQHGDASLLMRRVTLEDARTYRCDVYAPKQLGWGLIELILVQAEPTTPAQHQHQLIWLVVLLPLLLGVFAGQ
ncbi:UNVERIFIED_CONTAM: hypothetical protein FKN15_006829 [Acipenser sinensis]